MATLTDDELDTEVERKPPESPGRRAVDTAAETPPAELDPQTAADALSWFLEPEPQEVAKGDIVVNVAALGQPEHKLTFTIQVIDRERIRQIRRESETQRQDGTREVNEMEANLRIATEGLLSPDPRQIAAQGQKVRGQVIVDPAEALRIRFLHKPGIIDNIATRVLELSGYNDKDVSEIKAAGNS